MLTCCEDRGLAAPPEQAMRQLSRQVSAEALKLGSSSRSASPVIFPQTKVCHLQLLFNALRALNLEVSGALPGPSPLACTPLWIPLGRSIDVPSCVGGWGGLWLRGVLDQLKKMIFTTSYEKSNERKIGGAGDLKSVPPATSTAAHPPRGRAQPQNAPTMHSCQGCVTQKPWAAQASNLEVGRTLDAGCWRLSSQAG